MRLRLSDPSIKSGEHIVQLSKASNKPIFQYRIMVFFSTMKAPLQLVDAIYKLAQNFSSNEMLYSRKAHSDRDISSFLRLGSLFLKVFS